MKYSLKQYVSGLRWSTLLFGLAVIFGVLFSSCVRKKKLVYLQDLSENSDSSLSEGHLKIVKRDYLLQAGDLLDIQVRMLDPEFNEIFETRILGSSSQSSVSTGGDLYYMTGYSINDSGMVFIPVIGEVSVLGLSVDDAGLAIHNKFLEFFKEGKFYLTVRLGGIRYSAIGEFNRPGKYTVLQNSMTIFEAIANAGDLNITASRGDVKLIRQYPDGQQVHELNLLDKSLISSPYYFIQPNDVIYVEPLKQKSYGLGTEGAQSLTLILSMITSTLVIVSYFSTQ